MPKHYKIIFFQRGSAANGRILREMPLGGTESAMVSMAESLASLGHEVTVFCETTPLDYRGVNYQSWSQFEKQVDKIGPDIFICVRDLLLPFVRRWAPVQIYFSPDAMDQPFVNRALALNINVDGNDCQVGLFSLKEVKARVDAIFCVGAWQKSTFQQKFNIPSDQIYVAGNGVSAEFFLKSKPLAHRGKQVVYASTPYRGLEHLVDYWPAIKERVPQAQCLVLSGMQIYGLNAEEDQKAYGDLYKRASQAGVTILGAQGKFRMAEVFAQSRVMAYPNTFAETFCMAALEAQSCGIPIVSSDLAAMKERIQDGKNGYLVSGSPREANYRNEFVDRVVELLNDDVVWNAMSMNAQACAQEFLYENLAQKWVKEFDRLSESSNKSLGFFEGDYTVELGALINGYSKKIHIAHQAVTQCLAESLTHYGFEQSSGHFKKKAII